MSFETVKHHCVEKVFRIYFLSQKNKFQSSMQNDEITLKSTHIAQREQTLAFFISPLNLSIFGMCLNNILEVTFKRKRILIWNAHYFFQ